MNDKEYHCASDPEKRNDVLDAETLRNKLKRATDNQSEDAKTCRADTMQQNNTKNKLVIHNINGTNTEVNITPSQAASIAADIRDRCGQSEQDNHNIEDRLRQKYGDVSFTVICKMMDDEIHWLRKEVQLLRDMNAAIRFFRPSCRKCRWMVIEKSGKNRQNKITHYYCQKKRYCYGCWPDGMACNCEHYKRKGKSK